LLDTRTITSMSEPVQDEHELGICSPAFGSIACGAMVVNAMNLAMLLEDREGWTFLATLVAAIVWIAASALGVICAVVAWTRGTKSGCVATIGVALILGSWTYACLR
jgi:hypothetical protein